MTSATIHTINRAEFKHCTPDGDKLIAEIARVSNPANEKNEATAPRLIRYLITTTGRRSRCAPWPSK